MKTHKALLYVDAKKKYLSTIKLTFPILFRGFINHTFVFIMLDMNSKKNFLVHMVLVWLFHLVFIFEGSWFYF